jgi:hypothetical protein
VAVHVSGLILNEANRLRRVFESVLRGARDMARQIARSWEGRTSRRLRKKIEMLFAHLKRILKLDRLRLRGPNGARDEFILAATAQNLRKMAKLIPTPTFRPAQERQSRRSRHYNEILPAFFNRIDPKRTWDIRNCSRSLSKRRKVSLVPRGTPLSMAKSLGRSDIAVMHLVRNVLIGLVGKQQRRTDTDRGADTDVEGDRERGMICREQPSSDERRWSACNDRG